MNAKKIHDIFKRFQSQNPYPTTELEYKTPFELLMAVILSAQATDASVNKATKILFKIANTPQKIIDLGVTQLKTYIKSIGLFNTKATNIVKTAHILVDKYHSKVPDNRDELVTLPGVGRKTANVVLNTLFGMETIAVDRHIVRVCNRTKIAEGKTPLEVEKKLMQVVPKKFIQNAHHWLVLHGRYTCTARKPHCYECIIVDLCEYENKNFLPSQKFE